MCLRYINHPPQTDTYTPHTHKCAQIHTSVWDSKASSKALSRLCNGFASTGCAHPISRAVCVCVCVCVCVFKLAFMHGYGRFTMCVCVCACARGVCGALTNNAQCGVQSSLPTSVHMCFNALYHVYVHIYIYTHNNMYLCMYIYMYAHVYECAHTQIITGDPTK